MPYVSKEAIAKAREMDLLTWLQNYEPYNLVYFGGDTYCTKEHDSLKISNGKWHWFSKGIGGRSALDYLIKVQGYSLPKAVEVIIGRKESSPPVFYAPKPTKKKFMLPGKNATNVIIWNYLTGRGIHPEILGSCIKKELLYESAPYHSVVFVGYDNSGIPKYANLRGTRSGFKGEAPGSDKRFAFQLVPESPDGIVHVFESAIDLLSYATMVQLEGGIWQEECLLSLGGIPKDLTTGKLPLALDYYLKENKVENILLHLDNDTAGRNATKNLRQMLKGSYAVQECPPHHGKDVNDQLKHMLGLNREAEDYRRSGNR